MRVHFNTLPALDKARRAKLHLDSLENKIRIFLKSHPYRLTNDNVGEPANYFYDRDEFPSEFGLIAGDFVHNLRSSLDYLAFETNSISKNPINKSSCQFPIFDDPPASPKILKTFGGTFPYTPRSIKRLVDNLQPYNRRARRNLELLTILRELDNTDKHRRLLPTINWNLFIIHSEVADAIMYDGIQNSFDNMVTPFPYDLIKEFDPNLPNSIVFLVESTKPIPVRVVSLPILREIYVLVAKDIIPKFSNIMIDSKLVQHPDPPS